MEKSTTAFESFGNSGKMAFDGILGGISAVASAAQSFTNDITKLDAMQKSSKDNYDGVMASTKASEEEKATATKLYAKDKDAYNKRSFEAEINGAMSIAGATTKMFNQKSVAARAFHGIEMGLAIVSMAMSAKKMIVNLQEGASAMFRSGWAGFAGVIAMGAVMAGLGVAMTGGGGKTVDNTAPASKAEGTVLGDPTATSNSIDNIIKTLNAISDKEYPELKAIGDSFRGVDRSMYELRQTMAAWFGLARVREQLENAIERIGLITVEGGKLPQIIEQIEGEMIFNGGNLYQRAGSLVHAIHTEKAIEEKGVTIPANSLTIHTINETWLSHYFTKIAKWQKYNARAKRFERIDAEPKYSNTYFSLVGDWNLPVLRGITECPTLRRDGSLVLKSGYDKASGLYVDYQGEPVNVLPNPTKQDALDSLEILKQPLKDFSFLAEIDRAVILAAMLTAVVNYSLPTTPWFAIDAPIMGSGKSLLADIVSMLITGRKAIVISQGGDETEDEKRLGSLLMRGVPLLNLDNIERPVSGDMICSMTTQTQVSIRQLGQSKMIDLPTNCTKLATGNNIIFKGDMTRRVLLCQLDPQCERPDARKFDIDLNEWIPANRHKLLSAALTVLRAYIHAGKPLAGQITPYGSFDDWNNLIRASLLWLGVADPMDTRQRLESSDPVKSELGAVLALWFAAFGSNGKTAAEVVNLCNMNHDLNHALMDVAGNTRGNDAIDTKRLGRWLKKFEKRATAGMQ